MDLVRLRTQIFYWDLIVITLLEPNWHSILRFSNINEWLIDSNY
jgi:hypothetical protein